MKIAVCDDDRNVLLDLLSLLACYRQARRTEISCQGFENAIDLIASMEHESYDLLFLDVLMPGIGGIQAAHEIRRKNESVKIVFLTSSPEYAVESYRVQAANYLLKPATEESLFPILDEIFDMLRKPEEALVIQTQGYVLRLPYRNIEYIEVISKTIYFYLTGGGKKEVHGSLAEYEQVLLGRPEFFKVHRSYLVNLSWVAEVRRGELLTTSGSRVPISRSAYQRVRTAYTEFLFEDADKAIHSGGKG